MTRVLMLTHNRFWREGMGSQVRIATLVRHLLHQGHELHVVFSGNLQPADRKRLQTWPAALRVAATRRDAADAPTPTPASTGAPQQARTPGLQRWALLHHLAYLVQGLWAWLRCPQPGQAAHLRVPLRLALAEPAPRELHTAQDALAFAAAVADVRPQVLVVQYVAMVPLLAALPRTLRAGLRVAVDTHDVQSERRLRFHLAGQPHNLKLGPSDEALLLRRCDLVLAIQDADRVKLQALAGPVPVATMLHPVPLRLHPAATTAPRRVLFLGSGMAPNIQAVIFLLDEVWPALQRLGAPAFPLTVAGGVCSALAGRPLPPGVELAGVVADTARLYDTHAIVAAPVLTGGGLKIKVAEALGAGAAVVAMPLAAEGLEDAVNAGALRVVDGPDAFAAALLELLNDASAAVSLGTAALCWSAANLSSKAAYAALNALLTTESGSCDGSLGGTIPVARNDVARGRG